MRATARSPLSPGEFMQISCARAHFKMLPVRKSNAKANLYCEQITAPKWGQTKRTARREEEIELLDK